MPPLPYNNVKKSKQTPLFTAKNHQNSPLKVNTVWLYYRGACVFEHYHQSSIRATWCMIYREVMFCPSNNCTFIKLILIYEHKPNRTG